LSRFAVIDTNVLVSSVLTSRATSPPKRIAAAMIRGNLRFLLSEPLLAEYREVLLCPRISAKHGMSEADVDDLLLGIVVNATMRDPTAAVEGDPQAPGDEHVVALLKSMPGSVLVTGDRRLASAVAAWCEVATPADFAATLG
jgi:uncharacterized protein